MRRILCTVFLLFLSPEFLRAEELNIATGQQTENRISIQWSADRETRSESIPFLVYTPSNYLTDGSRKSPLLLFLHGLGESGNGNFELLKKHGPPRLSSTLDRFGFVIVSPQHALPVSMEDVPTAWRPDVLMSLVEQVCEKMSIDRDRIYVTGLSMGGFGTWRLVATHPDRFAAAIPICGGGEIEWADRLNTVPIWAFHGAKDSVVPLARSKEMVDAVQAMGGDVKLRIYPEAAHDSWTKTYDNPEIYEWMLRHSRKE